MFAKVYINACAIAEMSSSPDLNGEIIRLTRITEDKTRGLDLDTAYAPNLANPHTRLSVSGI